MQQKENNVNVVKNLRIFTKLALVMSLTVFLRVFAITFPFPKLSSIPL